MAKQKPSIPSGMRDFSPLEMVRRNYIFDTIKSIFKKYGYAPIETPAMEKLSTLLGKYGEEGDKLLFKVLNSGNFIEKADKSEEVMAMPERFALQISEKGLRYDLTVPFARFVVQHQNELVFPFKRYQIQPVWRADRPQKGRYREFYQCDVDVIGSRSLFNEAELILITDEIFNALNISSLIKINNRKILSGIAEIIGEPDKIIDITVAIDKLDKIGIENVNKELCEKGLSLETIELLQPIIQLAGTNTEKISILKEKLAKSEIGMLGISEIEQIFQLIDNLNITTKVELDLTLARGLNYYTGAIFEVKANDYAIGSICGGGRYDDLTGIFGMQDISGVGISFGADRIYDVMQNLNLFPESAIEATQILFANFSENEAVQALKFVHKLRQQGISAELYPDSAKLKKQLTYADKKNIKLVALIGAEELKNNNIQLKNMADGSQKELTIDELIAIFKQD